MKLDLRHPLNQGIVRQRSSRPNVLPLTLPRDHADPYSGLGSHPDIVEFVWDELNKGLAKDCRAVVFGTPALVHPAAGVVLALGYGTAYALRVPTSEREGAMRSGYSAERVWSTGERTNLESDLGTGWVFGKFYNERELLWLKETYRELSEGA